MLMFFVDAVAAPVTVGLVGQSNAAGYAAPYPCAQGLPDCHAIPVGAHVYQDGIELLEYEANFSGVEVGLAECLIDLGWEPSIWIRGINGANIAAMMNGTVPGLVADLAGQPLDAVVFIHGEQDSRSWPNAVAYQGRLFGPAYDQGGSIGHVDPTDGSWVQPLDRSVLGQLRAAWPGLPLILTELRTRDNADLVTGHLGDVVSASGGSTYPYHQIVRAAQHAGCAWTAGCYLLEAGDQYPTAGGSDLHYSSEGYWSLGFDLCTVIDSWALQNQQ